MTPCFTSPETADAPTLDDVLHAAGDALLDKCSADTKKSLRLVSHFHRNCVDQTLTHAELDEKFAIEAFLACTPRLKTLHVHMWPDRLLMLLLRPDSLCLNFHRLAVACEHLPCLRKLVVTTPQIDRPVAHQFKYTVHGSICELSRLITLEELDMSKSNIGKLPEEFSKLVCLTKLDLSNNYLGDDSMAPIARLTRLQYLDLTTKKYTKFKLTDDFTMLTSLTSLQTNAKISGSVFKTLKLKHLTWWGAERDDGSRYPIDMPDELCSMVSLETLDLSAASGDGIISISSNISALTALTALDVEKNFIELDCFPEEVSKLTSLIKLNISETFLGTIPRQVFALTALEELHARLLELPAYDENGEEIDSPVIEVPPEISELKRLKVLDLSGNDIREIPPEISALTALEVLTMSSCLG